MGHIRKILPKISRIMKEESVAISDIANALNIAGIKYRTQNDWSEKQLRKKLSEARSYTLRKSQRRAAAHSRPSAKKIPNKTSASGGRPSRAPASSSVATRALPGEKRSQGSLSHLESGTPLSVPVETLPAFTTQSSAPFHLPAVPSSVARPVAACAPSDPPHGSEAAVTTPEAPAAASSPEQLASPLSLPANWRDNLPPPPPFLSYPKRGIFPKKAPTNTGSGGNKT